MMKILVVDDKQQHRDAALALFVHGHDLSVVSTYGQAMNRLDQGGYDAFLTDLFLPAERTTLAPDAYQFIGQEIPVGLVLALAAAQRDVPFIGLATDVNHHKHPMSAALDLICGAYWSHGQHVPTGRRSGLFQIGNSRVLIAHAPFLEEVVGKIPCEWCPQTGEVCRYCQGTKERDNIVHDRKDWATLLAALTATPVEK